MICFLKIFVHIDAYKCKIQGIVPLPPPCIPSHFFRTLLSLCFPSLTFSLPAISSSLSSPPTAVCPLYLRCGLSSEISATYQSDCVSLCHHRTLITTTVCVCMCARMYMCMCAWVYHFLCTTNLKSTQTHSEAQTRTLYTVHISSQSVSLPFPTEGKLKNTHIVSAATCTAVVHHSLFSHC